MDSERFDRLARTVSQAQSRRQALRGLAGAVAIGALTLRGGEASADACKADGKPCKKPEQCCSGICFRGTGTGATSKSEGVCGCPEGRVLSNGTCFLLCPCINPSTGTPCPCQRLADGGGTICISSGTCVTACSDCLPGEACISGSSSASCPSGLACVTQQGCE
jgi:hypothetical protein